VLGAGARPEVEPELARGLELVETTGAKSYEALLRVERGRLASLAGDEEAGQRELREAHRLFTEIGAAARAESVAAELSQAPAPARD
jgi:hypothetical protein